MSRKKPSQGQNAADLLLSASYHAENIDAANKVRRLCRERAPGASLIPGSDGVQIIKNNTGKKVEQFGVVGLDGWLFDPSKASFRDGLSMIGVDPIVDHYGRFGIALEPMPVGASRPVRVFGVSQVQIDVLDEDHTRADVLANDVTKLQSGFGTAEIIDKEPGTGTKWAIVRFPTGHQPVFGTALGAHAFGSVNVAMNVWNQDRSAATGQTITGIRWKWFDRSENILDGDDMAIERVDGKWHVLWADCPPSA